MVARLFLTYLWSININNDRHLAKQSWVLLRSGTFWALYLLFYIMLRPTPGSGFSDCSLSTAEKTEELSHDVTYLRWESE